MRAKPLTLVPFLLVGCSNPGCACTPTAEAPTTSTTSGTEAEIADYEVHEWGLLRSMRDGSTEVLRAGAVAPARPIEIMAVDKPVLYFHARDPLTIRDVSVHVDGGTIVESWPFVEARAANGNADIAWHDVSLGALEGCESSPLPTATVLPCSLLGGAFCESAGLAVVRTDDAQCVRTNGSVERFLFYRAQSHTFTPPLRFAREQAFEDVRVTNDGDHPIPGVIVRIWSDGTRTRTLIADPPPPHESIVIGHAFEDGTPADVDEDDDRPFDRRGAMDESMPAPIVSGPGRDGLRRTLRELGLTTSEVGAFMRAWDTTLFSNSGAHAGATTDGIAVTDMPVDVLSVDGDPAPRESFLYFLPEPATDGVATLQFSPAPRTVRRALAIWTALRASGEGH